jgi:Short C-terminal domain
MVGHKWEPAEGTIIHSNYERMELPGKHGMHLVPVYEIDVRAADGTTGRERVPSAEYPALRPGTIVRLEISAKTGEIRLHPHRAKLIIGYSPGVGLTDDFTAAAPLTISVTNAGPAGAGLGQFFGGSFPGNTEVHVVGGLGGADAAEILRTVLSGDPADRAAAKEQLRHLAQDGGAGSPAGATTPSPSDRLAMLQQLVDRGQLSQEEFDAKRQQILDEI